MHWAGLSLRQLHRRIFHWLQETVFMLVDDQRSPLLNHDGHKGRNQYNVALSARLRTSVRHFSTVSY